MRNLREWSMSMTKERQRGMSQPETWTEKRKRIDDEVETDVKVSMFKAVPSTITGDFEDAAMFEKALTCGRRKADVYAAFDIYKPAATEENDEETVTAAERRCLEEVVEFERKKRVLAQCVEHVDGRYKRLMEEQRVQLAIELFRSVSKH